ncbi:MAG TPA: DUF3592 domain-containing protein [Thermoleophilaceae bacterium]|nr:DUF3592 domain-containing protein [Thermoleophilaceae bacterium]
MGVAVGLFSRKKDPKQELAEVIVNRGVRVRGTVESFAVDGATATMSVRFAPEGQGERTVTVVQDMAPQVQVGLEPGAPVELSYDRDDPSTVLIWGSPLYRTTEEGAVVRAVDVQGGERS